jgi:hypothetical protein
MTILTNGCSFTQGYNLTDPQLSWPHQLGKILNQDVINLAIGGGSNDRIYRTTIEFCNTQMPEYVVVGWTVLSRNDLSHSSGTYLRMAPDCKLADDCELPDDLTSIHQFWIKNLLNEYINFKNLLHYILHLQDYFKTKRISYKFFTALPKNYIYDFLCDSDYAFYLAQQSFHWKKYRNDYDQESKETHVKYQDLKTLVQKIDLTNWIMHTTTMKEYLKEHNYTFDHTAHPDAISHAHWANLIKNII